MLDIVSEHTNIYNIIYIYRSKATKYRVHTSEDFLLCLQLFHSIPTSVTVLDRHASTASTLASGTPTDHPLLQTTMLTFVSACCPANTADVISAQ